MTMPKGWNKPPDSKTVYPIFTNTTYSYSSNISKSNIESTSFSSSSINESKITNKITDRKKALIISVSDYTNKRLEQLEFCKNDGEKMYELLKSIGYDIPDNYKLIGNVSYEEMKKAIQDFFRKDVISKDTLLFYFSGHGVPEDTGEHYLATSEIDPEEPYDKGYSFDDLEGMINRSISTKKVTILDCCYSGAASPGKGTEEEAATLGRNAIDNRIKSGEGKCVLASSLSYQKSYASKEQEHSIFTYYLIDGLKGNKESINKDGSITPDSLGRYIYHKVTEKLPKQKPIRKVEASGDIILAQYPELVEKLADVSTIIHKGNTYFYDGDYEGAIQLFDEALNINKNSYVAYAYKGKALSKLELNNDAIRCFDEALKINEKDLDVLKDKGLAFQSLSKHTEAIHCFDEALEINSMNPKIWYYKGISYFNESNYKKSIECYNEALKLSPDYSDALRERGLAYEKLGRDGWSEKPSGRDISLILDEGLVNLQNGDYYEAIKLFDKAIEINTENPVSYNYKGDALYKLEKYEDAIQSYDEALKINPKYIDVLKDKGLCLDILGRYKEAIICFDEALKIRPNIAKNWYYKGITLFHFKNYDEAIKCFDEAYKINPTIDKHSDIIKYKIASLIQQGIEFNNLKKYEEAIRCYDKVIEIDPNNEDAQKHKHKTLGDSKKERFLVLIDEVKRSYENKDYSNVINLCDETINSEPDNYIPYLYKGLAFSNLGKYEQAVEFYDKVLQINPNDDNAKKAKKKAVDNINKKRYASIIEEVKNCIKEKKDYSNIISLCNNAIELDPTNPSSYVYKGLALIKLEKYEDAIQSYNKVLEIEPKNVEAIFGKGFALSNLGINLYNNKKYEEALLYFDNVLELSPLSIRILKYKGDSLQKLKQYDDSIRTYDKVLELEPQSIEVLFEKGKALYKLKKYEDAIACYDRVLEIDTNNKDAKKNREIAIQALEKKRFTSDLLKQQNQEYSFIAKWGNLGSGDGEFRNPQGIAVDSDNVIYVCDVNNHRIQKFDSNGNFITKWGNLGSGDGEFNLPRRIAVDASGYVYVADSNNHRIQKFTNLGKFVAKWGKLSGIIRIKDKTFNEPCGIAVDSSGYVYVCDNGNRRIQKFDSNGNFITKWGSKGEGDGEFRWPQSIAVDASGYVYVTDLDKNHRIQKFDSNGNFITKWIISGSSDKDLVLGIAIDLFGYVYVSDPMNHRIQKFDSNGNFITKWGSKGEGDGEFRSPQGVTFDSSGYVYVADWDDNRIKKFRTS